MKKMMLIPVEEFNRLSSNGKTTTAGSTPLSDPERAKIFDDKSLSFSNRMALDSLYLANLERVKEEMKDKKREDMTHFFDLMKNFIEKRDETRKPAVSELTIDLNRMSIDDEDPVIVAETSVVTDKKKAAVEKKKRGQKPKTPEPTKWQERTRQREKKKTSVLHDQVGSGFKQNRRKTVWLRMPFS